MNILLTNDDGIQSEGINILYDVLSKSHNVYIIAPDKEKSACSSAITVKSPIIIKKIAGNKYSVNGFPSDCVNIGLNGEIIPEVDLVISGINHGPNVGNDIHFSGTVAGARIAYIFGFPGIALSLDCMSASDYFKDASMFLDGFIQKGENIIKGGPVFLNINYPDLPQDRILGIKYTVLGNREYNDSFNIVEKKTDELTVQLSGIIESNDIEGTDVTELRKGYISITPLKLDCTDYSFLNIMIQKGFND
jgi:5'-nucleotidase